MAAVKQESPEGSDAQVPLSAVFALMGDHADSVVERALDYRRKATPNLRTTLNQAIDATVKGVDAFPKTPSKAPKQRLAPSILTSLDSCNDRLASAVLKVWDASLAPLRARAEAHLRAAGLPTLKLGAKRNGFERDWQQDEWQRMCEAMAQDDDAEDTDDDIRVMLCWVAGRLPCSDFPLVESPLLQHWLEELEQLPSDALDWEDTRRFAEYVEQLARDKLEEFANRHATALQDSIASMDTRFADELRYLEVDTTSWREEVESRQSVVAEAQDLAAAMEKILADYQEVRPQASSLDKEKRRATKRAQCEKRFFGLLKEWRKLMARPPAASEVRDSAGTYRVDAKGAASRERLESLDAENKALQADLDSLKAENAQLQAKAEGAVLEKAQLSDELGELKGELARQRETEQYWRQAYRDAKRPETDDHAPLEFATVADVLEHAAKAFGNELLIALNGKSTKNCPFQKPDEVYDALAWLATEYHRLRPSPGPSPDFDRLIREACPGWSYKPNQTETTMGMYSEWYRTAAGGKSYVLSSHIGKGSSRDPKNTIRIAFDWDQDLNRVVIGYIGLHQRNRQS